MKKIISTIFQKNLNTNFSLLFKINLIITSLLFLLFLLHNESYTVLSFILSFLGAISSVTILFIIYYISLYLLSFTNKFILYFSGLLFFITNIGLIIDFFIFRLYKFHINAMVLNILMSPDAMDSIQLGVAPLALFIVIIFLAFFLEIYLIKRILNTNSEKKIALNRKLNKLMIMPLFLIILSEKTSYGFASLFTNNEVLSKFKVIPLYQPLTFNRIAAKYFNYKAPIEIKNTIQIDALLDYPKNKIEIKNNPNKINIFIFASDAIRNSIITEETAPNLSDFKNDSISFNNHYSGGNATRFGIFSLMYGVNSTYWFSFLNANRGSVLFDVLQKLDYKIDIISSTNTNWPEFKKTCYVDIQENVKDDFKGKPWEKDEQCKNYFLNLIDNYDKKQAIFSFIFLDSPHGYSFPSNYNKFQASSKNINYLTVTNNKKDINSIFSRYKNSVYYNDKLFLDMINKLKEKDLYDNSLIIYTSDHGEEFYEYGFFGHNSSFSKAQVNSPFIVKLPKSMNHKKDVVKSHINSLTSHNDIVPSILSMIGVKNKTSDYSNGQNLLSQDFNRDYVFTANWNHNAIITKDSTYIFSNLPNKMFNNEVRDTKTYKKVQKKSNANIILNVMNENRNFLK